MTLLIDTSAVIGVVMNEPERDALLTASTGKQLVAPASLPWEMAHA